GEHEAVPAMADRPEWGEAPRGGDGMSRKRELWVLTLLDDLEGVSDGSRRAGGDVGPPALGLYDGALDPADEDRPLLSTRPPSQTVVFDDNVISSGVGSYESTLARRLAGRIIGQLPMDEAKGSGEAGAYVDIGIPGRRLPVSQWIRGDAQTFSFVAMAV